MNKFEKINPADYTVCDGLDAVTSAHYEEWETKGQPKLHRACVTFVEADGKRARFQIFTGKTEEKVRAKAVAYALRKRWTIKG
jgi:hypothetical protein